QDASVGGTPCWQIAGEVDLRQLSFFGNGSQAPNRTVHTNVCVGKADSELHAVTFAGPVSARDTAQTTRTFTLSAFGKPVTIKPPATATPASCAQEAGVAVITCALKRCHTLTNAYRCAILVASSSAGMPHYRALAIAPPCGGSA